MRKQEEYSTLKGPLFVLKAMPGMYLSQTGKPLQITTGFLYHNFQTFAAKDTLSPVIFV